MMRTTIWLVLATAALGDLQKPPSQVPADAPKLSPVRAEDRAAIKAEWLAYLGDFPKERAPLAVETLASEELPEFTRQHVRYQIEDGVFTDGYLLTPKN